MGNKHSTDSKIQQKLMEEIRDKLLDEEHTVFNAAAAMAGLLVWLIVIEAAENGWVSAKQMMNDLITSILNNIKELSEQEMTDEILN